MLRRTIKFPAGRFVKPGDTHANHQTHQVMSDEKKSTNESGSEPSFESAKAHVKEAAEHLRSAATAKGKELREKAEAKAGEFREKAGEIRGKVETKAQEFRETAEEKAQDFRERAEQKYGEARARSRTFQDDGEAYIRENPMRAVMTALGVGFVLGILFRR